MSAMGGVERRYMPSQGSLPVTAEPENQLQSKVSERTKVHNLNLHMKSNHRLQDAALKAMCVTKNSLNSLLFHYSDSEMSSGINEDDVAVIFQSDVTFHKVKFAAYTDNAFENMSEEGLLTLFSHHPEIRSLRLEGFSHISEETIYKIMSLLPNLTNFKLAYSGLTPSIKEQILANSKLVKTRITATIDH